VLLAGMAFLVKTGKMPPFGTSMLAVERVLSKAKAVKRAMTSVARNETVGNTL